MVGAAVQDYLKVIYKLTLSELRCTPSVVAERMSVSPAAVTKMVKRLQELNLVTYSRNQEIELTPAGEKIALEMIRHHRLLELYLMEALGYTWDQVDVEAEKLEHVISEEFEDRIDAFLGHPTHDPHGDPIPTKEGYLELVRHERLTSLEPGQCAVIRRVTDGDPAMLRYLGGLGLYPDTAVEMLGREPYGGSLRVRVSGEERHVGQELADNVFVSREDTKS
ncbi:MAG: iron (metal) dependent repressor, DtxR family [Armatimonadetes bacterium]|jgi:DtxR family Mn-dependent transcriptional regulator|nr:iron (metal) dependent repressor, DtxR family [Armatimonadota bacterium]